MRFIKTMRLSFLFSLCVIALPNFALAAYENVAYLPYYRLPSPDNPAFDFANIDPSPYLTEPLHSRRGSTRDRRSLQDYMISALATGRITQVNYFNIGPQKDGSLNTETINPRHLEYLLKLRASYPIKIYISIHGSTAQFLPLVNNSAVQEIFEQNVINFSKEWQLDGVDFDWEYPSSAKALDAYIEMITKVRSALRDFRPDAQVSVAVSRAQRLKQELFSAVDKVNFMSYDFDARHATYEDSVEMVSYLSTRYKIPLDKIYLGLPFYGRIFNLGRSRKAMAYYRLLEEYDISPDVNEVGNYYFNGQNMIARKYHYAKDMGLGGLMVWEIGLDSIGVDSLLRVLPAKSELNS